MNANDYDRLVNWEKRLTHEWPFYDGIFRARGVKTILDCACGTGRHAILFSQKGFLVTGTDRDPAMIERAEANASPRGADLRFREAAFSDLSSVFPPLSFDAVICVGNSLSLLPDLKEVEQAVRNMSAVCRPGGLLVLHILNYHSLLKREIVPRPLRVVEDRGEKRFFQKIFVPRPHRVDVIVVQIAERGDGWGSRVTGGHLLPIMPSAIEELVRKSGFSRLDIRGDYEGGAFEPECSQDLILTAEKTGVRAARQANGEAR